MAQATAVQVVRLRRIDGDSKLKAFADVSIGDFTVRGLRVVEGVHGLFLSMPSEKAKDGKWYDTFFPATKEAQKVLADTVLTEYRK